MFVCLLIVMIMILCIFNSYVLTVRISFCSIQHKADTGCKDDLIVVFLHLISSVPKFRAVGPQT